MNHMYYDASMYEAIKGFSLLLKSGKEIIQKHKESNAKSRKNKAVS